MAVFIHTPDIDAAPHAFVEASPNPWNSTLELDSMFPMK